MSNLLINTLNNEYLQPIINIGMLGSVSDGKSTTVYSLTGIKTQRHSNEMKRNITIKPGYANMKIYKTIDQDNKETINTKEGELIHHVSFIDCPGHYQLIVTMMSCIRLMDGIILVVSAAEDINKKPQLIQHIMAIKMSGIKNVIVLLNKLDLVKKSVALERYTKLCHILKKYEIEPKVIIPVSMNHKIGVDNVLKSIMKYMGPDYVQERNKQKSLFMISRSFDINHVNIKYDEIVGGVIGGSLIGGNLKVGDEIEILPGIIGKNPDGTLNHKPHISIITSLKSETTDLQEITSGGLIGIGTNIDPFYCKNDNMIGMLAGLKGTLPDVYYEITIKYTEIKFDDYMWVTFISKPIIIIVGTNNIEGKILNYNDTYIHLRLNKPACIPDDSIVILCEKSPDAFHIVAYGNYNKLNNQYEFIKEEYQSNTDNHNDDLSDDSIDLDDI
jgi:translation initiation factor 2 subunit 3